MAPSRGILSLLSRYYICPQCQTRNYHTSGTLLSGHSRWSKIKHDKGKKDAAKHRQRSAFAREIVTTSRLFGPEPSTNPRLANLITKAKREGFPKALIEAAVARGQGRSTSGATLESVMVEGILPNNVAIIIDCETDSKRRTLADVRLVVKENGGTATPTSYLFEKRGRVVFEKREGVGVDEMLEPALEAGATEVEEGEDGRVVLTTEPGDTKLVGEAVASQLGLHIVTFSIVWSPNDDTKVDLPSEDAAAELNEFLDELLEESSVQSVSMNVGRGKVSGETWKGLQSRIAL